MLLLAEGEQTNHEKWGLFSILVLSMAGILLCLTRWVLLEMLQKMLAQETAASASLRQQIPKWATIILDV
ncbi:MAG: hypothetical protein R3E31_25740 [Chloroflexota bacterium]